MNFKPGAGAVTVSWQGVNDISAHPASTGPAGHIAADRGRVRGCQTIVLNTLGSLTNRENRFASPRFSDDFNVITRPDLHWPGRVLRRPQRRQGSRSLSFALSRTVHSTPADQRADYSEPGLPSPTCGVPWVRRARWRFPYIFPALTRTRRLCRHDQFGWIHSPTPVCQRPGRQHTGRNVTSSTNALGVSSKHKPQPARPGRQQPIPDKSTTPTGYRSPLQTWWGFPTWRETLSVNWTDPTRQVNDNSTSWPSASPTG